MNVSRGTPVTKPGAWRVVYLSIARHWRTAFSRDLKSEMRVPINATNSRVHPGAFEGLDLDSGRALRNLEVPELRARCRFESGKVRAVIVTPTYGRGDLIYTRGRGKYGGRASSEFTLEVIGVDVVRVRDMCDEDALAEGVEVLPKLARINGGPTDWFRLAWEDRYGVRAWNLNEWCWVLRVRVHHEQVDKLLKRWEADGYERRTPRG